MFNTGYSTITKKQLAAEKKKLKQATKEIASSPESARAYLIRAGILDESGNPAAKYR